MDTYSKNSSRFSSRILIVGGGLCGIAVAIALSRSGHKVIVFERMPALVELGAGIQLPPNATRIFQQRNILQHIMQDAYVPREGTLRSYRGTVLTKQASGIEVEEKFGSPYLVIHRADLLKVLVSEAQNLGVEIKLGANVTKIDFETPSISLLTGEVFEGDVVFGADGERSLCRDTLLGHADIPQSTGDLVFRIAAKRDDASQLQNLKDLISQPSVNLWLVPDAHAVSYLLKNDILNVVLVIKDTSGAKTIYGPQKAAVADLKDAFKTGTRSSRPFWTKFAVIGDAAHAMLPYLPQGAAQAFEDAAVLGALFSEIDDISQIPKALSIYETLRKPRAMEVRKRTLAQKIMYGVHDGPHQEARDRQLALTAPMEGMQKWLWGSDVVAQANEMSKTMN